MRFKITSVNNIDGFSKALDACIGNVELITEEGERLNLKSKLSQLISINTILSGVSKLENIELYIENETDVVILMNYISSEK